MIRTIMCTMALLLLVITPAASVSASEISLGGWQQSISGPLSHKALGETDVIELDEDIAFDDENRIFGRLKIELPSVLPNIYLIAAPMDFEGSGDKDVALKFGDTTFAANVDLDTQITMNQYDFALYFGLPFVETGTAGVLNVDLGVNARLVDFKATINGREDGTGLNVEENQSLTVVVPMAYIALQFVPADWLAIEAEGRGIAIGDNRLLSVIGRVKYRFSGPVFAAAGYRLDNLEIDEADVVLDTEFKGPFIEFGIKF